MERVRINGGRRGEKRGRESEGGRERERESDVYYCHKNGHFLITNYYNMHIVGHAAGMEFIERCMHTQAKECVYTCTYARTNEGMHARTHARTHECMHARTHAHAHVHTHT